MDSLGVIGGRNKMSEPFRNFLKFEWQTKKGNCKNFTKNVMPEFFPTVPLQTNNSDCGLFLVHYVENFLKVYINHFSLSN